MGGSKGTRWGVGWLRGEERPSARRRGTCLTGVIESVLNYYSRRRACLTVELPVKRPLGKPEPVKGCQSGETRGVGLMDFSGTPLRLRRPRSCEGGDEIDALSPV